MLSEIARINQGLDTFKGVGSLRISAEEGRRALRAAWIAQAPDRFRLELMGIAGVPAASVAADGSMFSAYLHDRGRGYRHRLGEDGLEDVVGIKIRVAEVVALLGGRVHIGDFGQAVVEEGVLVLKDGAGRTKQRIHPPWEQGKRWVVALFDDDGKLRCRVLMTDPRQQGGYTVPGTIQVTTAQRGSLRVSVERFWANPDVAPAVFELPAESSPSAGGP